MKSSSTAMRQVREYLLSFLLFLLIFSLSATAQPDFRAYTYWRHPVIKKLEKHDPTVIAFTEKSDDLVVLCIADTTEGLAYYVTQFGSIFDTLHLTVDRKKQLQTDPKKVNPFRWFEEVITQYDPVLEDAKDYLRKYGANLKQASLAQQAVLEMPSVKRASSTLAKLLVIEEYERQNKGILLHFNWWINSSRDPGVVNSLSEGKKLGSLVIHGTLKSGYTEFINKDQLSGVRAAKLDHSTGIIRVFDWGNNAIDSFLINKAKIGLLLNEKTDVFALYRVWLEYKLQIVNTSIPSWMYAANYELLKNREFIYAGFVYEKSAKSRLARLQQEKRELLKKIDNLSKLNAGLFSTIIACPIYEPYRRERRKWDLENGNWMTHLEYWRGYKRFELTDHRGNVMATVSDRKTGIDLNNDGTVDYYEADITTATEYFPFGSQMPGKKYAKDNIYRYGYNGKENDNEVKGTGNQQDYGMRIYDPRLGRFLSVDPITTKHPELTPYQFASNTPIQGIDLDGMELLRRFNQSSPLSLTQHAFTRTIQGTTAYKILDGSMDGVSASGHKTWNFFTRDAYKAETWKNAGKFIEELIMGSAPGVNYETPIINSKAKDFKDNVINGDAYSRAKYLSETTTDILTAYAGSKGLSALKTAGLTAIRTNLAARFYAEAGFTAENAVQHMEGINFTKSVQTVTLRKGTVIQQWVGEKVGNYFTTLENGEAQNLGVSYEGRTLQQFTLTEDVKVLRSTASDLNGQAGGGTQYFSPELKNKIKPTTSSTPTSTSTITKKHE